MSIHRIIVFGDSLQDNGNLMKLAQLPGKPYCEGRFSNGAINCEYLCRLISERQNKEVALKNYAVGGAYTIGRNPKASISDYAFSVADQLDQFVASEGRLNQNELVLMNGGGNNFLFAFHNEKPYFNIPAMYRVAVDLIQIVERLIKLGAREIVISNIPDVTATPLYNVTKFPGWSVKAFKAFMKRNIVQENKKLEKGIERLQRKYTHVNIRLFNLHALFQKVLESPIAYGFENATDVCIKSFGGVDENGKVQAEDQVKIERDPNTHLFWDYAHPTSKGHQLLAEHMYKLLYPL